MPPIITSLSHPYWALLGLHAMKARTELKLSQAKVAASLRLAVRTYAALESGFVPPDVHRSLSRMSLTDLDNVLGWEAGTALGYLDTAVAAAFEPGSSPLRHLDSDRSSYPQAAWVRLGKAVRTSRLALKMTKPVLGYAMKSTSKTVLRLEEGRVYGDPRKAPPGDYNSEKYLFKRLPLLEMALEWDAGQATEILEGSNLSQAA